MLKLIHDTHIGAIRSAGTTPQSAIALRAFLREEFTKLLNKSKGADLVLLGDIFDTYNVLLTDLLYVYEDLRNFLAENTSSKVHCVIGNHDYSTDSSKLSSFQMLAKLLKAFSPSQVTVLDCAGGWIGHGVYAISHMPNQDLFDAELAKVPPCDLLLLHSNYDNNFALEKDHSLNMSAEQVKTCPAKQIYFAHEHEARTAQGGKVLVGGNQYPSSISDCLAGRYKSLRAYDPAKGTWSIETSWDAANYAEIDWKAGPNPGDLDAQFVRVVGQATAEEAAEANSKVVAWRKASKAFVLASAVKTLQDGLGADLALQSVEAVRGFDVMAALRKVLTEEDMEILEKLQ